MGLFDFLGGNPPATPTPSADPTVVAQNPAFKVPVLGPILDTGRDLLVGPGNEKLTTQEQITRAILNTLVLSKSPEALPGMWANNARRDDANLATLGSPVFKTRVGELLDGGMEQSVAIAQAAREYNVSGGIALPTSVADLPPTDLGETMKFIKDDRSIKAWNKMQDPANQTRISPYIDPKQTMEAQQRAALGLAEPGDAELLKAQAAVVGRDIPDPNEFLTGPDGQVIDPVTGSDVAFPGAATRLSGVQNTSGIQGPPSALIGPPPGGANGPPTGTDGPQALTPELADAAVTDTKANGVSAYEPTEIYDSVNQKVVPGLRRRSPEEIQQLRVIAQKHANDLDRMLEKSILMRQKELQSAADESEVTAIRANAAMDVLKEIAGVVNEKGESDFKGKNAIWSRYEPFDYTGKQGGVSGFIDNRFNEAGAKKYEIEQWWRTQNKNMRDNVGLGVYYGLEGPVATLTARIFGDTRLSDEDRRVFKEALPSVYDVGMVAEQKFNALPEVVNRIAQAMKDRTTAGKMSRKPGGAPTNDIPPDSDLELELDAMDWSPE
jgi:hypothetical protein